ncbi:MAG TPA: hypothetical protein VFI11_11990 [Anaerolineales bacterium]|nr:hypothetical protein [Anaerolineales bacterium]
MKVIDKSEFRDENGQISLENRVRGTLRYGGPWYGIMQAQVEVTERLSKSLGKDYSLLRNILVPNTGLIASMILVGPQGVRALMATPVGGVFRAKGDEWLVQASGGFRKSLPNLQQLAVGTAEVVLTFLREKGLGLPDLEPVLIFTNPRAHVDTAHPRARIVMADAIEHFAANLLQADPIMDAEDVQVVVDALLRPPKAPEPEPEPAPPAPARRMAPPPPPRTAPISGPFPDEAPVAGAGPFKLDERPAPLPGSRRLPRLSLRQWALLGFMLAVEVVIIVVFALVIAQNAYLF